MNLKGFYHEILKQMEDEFYAPDTEKDASVEVRQREDRRSYKVLERRIAEWVVRLGVEVIIADGAQWIDRVSDDASEVTERIQTFLDRRVVPLVLIGNGKSHAFFAKIPDLSARLGKPIELKRLDPDNSAQNSKDFGKFCTQMDDALVSTNAIPSLSELDSEEKLDALLAVASGHIGRVARLIEEPPPLAVRRSATSIETFDLSVATRDYAIANGWIDNDPFSS